MDNKINPDDLVTAANAGCAIWLLIFFGIPTAIVILAILIEMVKSL